MVNHIAHNSVSISIVLEFKYLIKFSWIMGSKTSKKFDPWMDIISQVGLVNFLGILICLDAKNTNCTSSLAFLSRDFVDSREKCSPRQVSLSYCLKSRFKLRPTPHTLLGIKICFLDTKICAMLDEVCCIFLENSANSVFWVSH